MPRIYKRTPLAERFWKKVNKDGPTPDFARNLGPCWVWTGRKYDGYGYIWSGGDTHLRSHRLAYEMLVGPIPNGLTLDHVCRNRACCNPAHLEAVSNKVNVLRGTSSPAINAKKTHCKKGHEFTEENTIRAKNNSRVCRECNKARCRITNARLARLRAQAA